MRDELGDRMKRQYEDRTRYMLPRRTYTLIRVDGRAFHTLCRPFEKPFDRMITNAMDAVASGLVTTMQNARFAYVQSDEVSLLMTDFETVETEAMFDNNVQKLASVSASIATACFNAAMPEWRRLATFDSRVWTIPDPTEVENYFLWRQKDAVRNSINAIAQSRFGHSACQGMKVHELVERLELNDVMLDEVATPRDRMGGLVEPDGAMTQAFNWREHRWQLISMIPRMS